MFGLRLRQKIGFGLGCVLNTLCATMWFTLLLFYFDQVLEMDQHYSSIIMIGGFLVNGYFSVLVGWLSDKHINFILCLKFGQRKSWHLVGFLCTLVSFPFIFQPCLISEASGETQAIYYSVFVMLNCFGWASQQICQLSLIPNMSSCLEERTGLASISGMVTVICNTTVFIITRAFFGTSEGDFRISEPDVGSVKKIIAIVMGLGMVSSVLFHYIVEEKPRRRTEVNSVEEWIPHGHRGLYWFQPMGVKDWLSDPQFYQVAGIYLSSGLFVHLSQTYLPLFLHQTLKLKSSLSLVVPLVMFSSGFVSSMTMKPLNRIAGRKVTYLMAAVVGLATSALVHYGYGQDETGVFFVAILLGASGSAILVTNLSLTAELIGNNTETSAFVFGVLSFVEKVSNAVAFMVIQHYIPTDENSLAAFFTDVIFFGVGGSALLGMLSIATLAPFQVGKRWRDRNSEDRRSFSFLSQEDDGDDLYNEPWMCFYHDSPLPSPVPSPSPQ